MQDAEPTVLSDSITDHDNTGGAGQGDLNDGSTNSAGAAANDDVGAGRCWIDTNDNNKMYIYVGVAGDGNGSWVEANAARIKAGAPNVLYHGDWDMGSVVGDGCNTPTTTTTAPLGWTVGSGAPTFAYAAGTAGQGVGCVMTMTATGVDDYITQTLTNLKAATTYRVIGQVVEVGTDECQLVTSGASTDIAQGDMISVDSSAFVTVEGFFVTGAALDAVEIRLMNSANTDGCSWDHVAVYRQDNTDIPEAGVQIVPRVLTEADITAAGTCLGNGNPIACCTGAGAGATCDITAAYQDVSDMSIVWTPPSEGWNISLQSSVSIGCDSGNCGALDRNEGAVCRLEKGGVEITASERGFILPANPDDVYLTTINLNAAETNPVAGTEITYTVACRWLTADGDLIYNPTIDSLTPDTSFIMTAYPPH
jgi:hypothetical protein